MSYLAPLALAVGFLALLLALAAFREATNKFLQAKSTRGLQNLQIEVAELSDSFGKLTKLMKRMIARENMRQRRSGSTEKAAEDDGDFLKRIEREAFASLKRSN